MYYSLIGDARNMLFTTPPLLVALHRYQKYNNTQHFKPPSLFFLAEHSLPFKDAQQQDNMTFDITAKLFLCNLHFFIFNYKTTRKFTI
jgi:hypothetical protein